MNLKEWLESCGAFDVQSCKVVIGKATYEAARYKQKFDVPQNSPAWQRGERDYIREQVYCIGKLPASYKRSRKTCFRFIGDSRDWYVVCYVPQSVATDSRYAKFHPFGQAFQLGVWSVPDGTSIDHYEPKPYRRVGASVNYCEHR